MQGATPSVHLRLIRSLLTFLHEIINFDIEEDISLWPRSQRAVCGLPVSGLYSAHRFDEWEDPQQWRNSKNEEEPKLLFLQKYRLVLHPLQGWRTSLLGTWLQIPKEALRK